MVRTGTATYTVTIRLKSTGSAGKLSLQVVGRDSNGATQGTTVAYMIH
jgi:hypothetical protein